MNLLPIWHTSSNNYQKFKISKKRTDLRINGELITNNAIIKEINRSNRNNNNNNNSPSNHNKNIPPTSIIYNHIKQNDAGDDYEEYDEYDDENDDDYTEYISLRRDFASKSSNALLDNNNKYSTSRLGSETIFSASTDHFNISSIDANQINKVHIKNKNNNKNIDLISIPNVEINSKIRKFFFHQDYSDNQNVNLPNNNKNRYSSSKGSKNSRLKQNSDAYVSTAAIPQNHHNHQNNSISSLTFASSYDSDMFRYQSWIMPDLKATALNLTRLNNNNIIRYTFL